MSKQCEIFVFERALNPTLPTRVMSPSCDVDFFSSERKRFAAAVRTTVRAPARRLFRPTNVSARRPSQGLWSLSRAHDAEPPPVDRLVRASRLARARLSVTRRPRESHRGHGAVPSRQGPGQGQFRHRDARDQGGEPLREIRRGTSASRVISAAALARDRRSTLFFASVGMKRHARPRPFSFGPIRQSERRHLETFFL